MISLDSSLKNLATNNAQTSAVKALAKLDIHTVNDLLFYFPTRYLDFSKYSNISDIKAGEIVTIKAKIKTIGSRFSFKTRKGLAEAVVSDNTGSLKVTWFNQGYLAKSLKNGDELLLSGRAEQYKGLQMINPVHEKFTTENIHTGRIVPIYRVTEGLYHKTIRSLVSLCLPAAKELVDPLPQRVLQEKKLPSLAEAIAYIHFPDNDSKLEQAQHRFIFEEVFIQQLAVAKHKMSLEKQTAAQIKQDIPLIKSFLAKLPFKLTVSQKTALWEIVQDISLSSPMNRLLEGDVGSGKTLVAVAAALETASQGFQVVLLAPTEILAKQHYDTFNSFPHLRESGIDIGLLTNHFQLLNNKEVPKNTLINAIKKHRSQIIIGTHALLQGTVDFKNLALVIIDEQHRFGVKQRSMLIKNTHLLSMSATPIPRTLALAFYGDLKVSTLTELPKGRQKIITSIVPENKRLSAYDFIKKEIISGRQAFIVTPRVEENETATIKSAKAELARLHKEVFPTFKLGLIHGKMKGKEKDEVMSDFNSGKIDILVATSVIEIGIDVPNASIMLIEDADNFGLAQLHQLRGRVGRGQHKSYCLLFTNSQNASTLERLKLFSNTGDGFKLAEIDLKQRGFGSLFGTEQTGFSFKFSKFLSFEILKSGKTAAEHLLAEDADLEKYPLLKRLVDPLTKQIHLE